ncbi:hypothetical protein MOE77_18510 [Bacillus inaquosorum]|uniref:hypothetical protein n=1 Tax=Bacillus inaquosorum TaxID=483913 RepID=UPI00227FC875|nr:hypothetical protein [Bacillus inaquosorum]MCY9038891.1 hypothetical protein [Bacillus inaquosorum]MCY9047590.1 hypothetical protein [Bacillus inaquosorum]
MMKIEKIRLSYLKENDYLPDEEKVVFDIKDAKLTEEGESIFLETKQILGLGNCPLLQKDQRYVLKINTIKEEKSIDVVFVKDLSTNTFSKLEFEVYIPKVKFISF